MMNHPIIKIEIENLKQRIIGQIVLNEKVVEESIAQQIEEAVEHYPWEEQVKSLTHKAINEALKNYFEWGDGYKAIKSSVEATVGQVFSPQPPTTEGHEEE